MRISTLLVAGLVVAAVYSMPAVADSSAVRKPDATQPIEVSAAKRKHVHAYRAQPRAESQIACTRFGCRPIPRDCRIETEYNPFTWNPSGFDAVVCPSR